MTEPIDAIVFTKPNCVEIGRFELPEPEADQVVVKTLYTLVSPGTEGRVLGGHYDAQGHFPFIPGYIAVGEVIWVGEQAEGWRIGDNVTGRNPLPVPGVGGYWGGQASRHIYPSSGEQRPVLLPEGADPLDYVVSEIAAISLRGAEAALPQRDETAVVIGLGMIGALSAAWLQSFGCRVAALDPDKARRERALRGGCALVVDASASDAEAQIQRFCNGGADIVVEASGSIPGVELAYKLLRRTPVVYKGGSHAPPLQPFAGKWPRLVMQANYLDNVSHNPHGFTSGEGVTILSPADRGVEDRQRAVESIRQGRINPRQFRDAVLPFRDAPQAYQALQNREYFSVVFQW
jgi:2-desacetyl-2-hydroxyethyl bacteriochlorophyllide A dehydrogenase